jgi:hypothetical protein
VRFIFLAVPTELAEGRYPAPAWVILGLGGAVIVGAAVFLAVRLLRPPRRARERALDPRRAHERALDEDKR